MKIKTLIDAALIACVLGFAGCTNTQPAYYGTYPSDYKFSPNHGYDPYASAPHDPVGAYYQNFAPATPYYYEPPESHRDCDERPCMTYPRNAGKQALEPEIIALPAGKPITNPHSTISRSLHATSEAGSVHPHDSDRE
jgi:hypothetical protein